VNFDELIEQAQQAISDLADLKQAYLELASQVGQLRAEHEEMQAVVAKAIVDGNDELSVPEDFDEWANGCAVGLLARVASRQKQAEVQ
jgi:hypothetical protein